LKIIACIKQVPDSEAKVKAEGGKVTWGDAPLVINPFDEYAVEGALQQKEANSGSTVTASSWRPDGPAPHRRSQFLTAAVRNRPRTRIEAVIRNIVKRRELAPVGPATVRHHHRPASATVRTSYTPPNTHPQPSN